MRFVSKEAAAAYEAAQKLKPQDTSMYITPRSIPDPNPNATKWPERDLTNYTASIRKQVNPDTFPIYRD